MSQEQYDPKDFSPLTGERLPKPIVVRLCSAFDPQTRLTCDLEQGHRDAQGRPTEHRATAVWGADGRD